MFKRICRFFGFVDFALVRDGQGVVYSIDDIRTKNNGLTHLFDDVSYDDTYPHFTIRNSYHAMHTDINWYPELLSLCRVIQLYYAKGLYLRLSKDYLNVLLLPGDLYRSKNGTLIET